MIEKTKKEKILFGVLLGLVGVALLGSLWAWAKGGGECGSCSQAQGLLGGLSLAPLGVGVYGILLAGILLAASVHVVLLSLLFSRGIFCGPCMLVGGAVVLAGLLSLFIDPDNLARGSVLIPLGVFVTHAALFALGGVPRTASDRTAGLAPPIPEQAEPATNPGTANLIIFTRAGCRYCEELEEQVLPGLLQEFGKALEISRRLAPPGVPSPTLVVGGAFRAVFPGLPPTPELRSAILRALGRPSQ